MVINSFSKNFLELETNTRIREMQKRADTAE